MRGGCVSALVLCAIPLSSVCAPASDAASTQAADSCVSQFEPGPGWVTKDMMSKLHVDARHGVSTMMLPGFAAAAYSLSLVKGANGKWSLSYVIDNSFSSGGRYRVTVPFLSDEDAQRIETVWTKAIAEAKPTPSGDRLSCIQLDGWSYVFSVDGRQANNFAGQGAIPHQLVEISNTLRLIAVDTRNTGHPVVSSLYDLESQVSRLEGDLKINSH
jgi:hypothetical protein